MQVDPAKRAQSPVISQIYTVFLVLFSLNGHLVVFKLLYESYDLIPLNSIESYQLIMEMASRRLELFMKAVLIVLPIVSLLFLMNLGIGFITKSAPQLNLFSFGFPLTILGTFFALYFSVDALQFVFGELIEQSLEYVKLVLLGGQDG